MRVLRREVECLCRNAIAQQIGIEKLKSRLNRLFDDEMGYMPAKTVYMLGAEYTPEEFANSVCFPGEYEMLTSFTHHPFGERFALETPDNQTQEVFLNVPIDQLMQYIRNAISHGHPVCWEGDISEEGFRHPRHGFVDVLPSQLPTTQAAAREVYAYGAAARTVLPPLADIDKSFRLPKMLLDLGKDRNVRRGSGKRSVTKTDLKQGRYVRAEQPKSKVTDLAFDATIRAAAPYQRLREDNGCALNIKEEDLRQKVREKRIGNTFLFAVDASGSMGARERMRAVKGAIFYMLQEAYQKRDRVGMIAFRRDKADMLLPITRSVDLAQKRLAEMPTGGKTPLADGLALSLQTLALLNTRDSELEPILIVVTDGRANAVHEGEKDPVAAAIGIAEKIAKAKITSVVIDTESDFIKLGIAKKLAAAMQANYYTLQRLSKENIIHIVRNLN